MEKRAQQNIQKSHDRAQQVQGVLGKSEGHQRTEWPVPVSDRSYYRGRQSFNPVCHFFTITIKCRFDIFCYFVL